jgi:general secretion pathway protein G
LAPLEAPARIYPDRDHGRRDHHRHPGRDRGAECHRSRRQFYRLDNFQYPSTEQGLEALVTKPNDPAITNWKSGGYLDRVPKDPWGNPYQYLKPGNNGEIDIYTLGRDGRPGGEGIDADIGNWNLD